MFGIEKFVPPDITISANTPVTTSTLALTPADYYTNTKAVGYSGSY